MATEGGLKHHLLPSSTTTPVSPPSTTDPASPLSDNQDSNDHHHHHQDSKEDLQPSLDAASFHRGLISLKQMQERSFSLVNHALLRQKLVEEQIKIERDTADAGIENNNDDKSVNNNNHQQDDSFEEARRRFLTENSGVGAGRLAFSVENILAPGKFGREVDDDSDNLGNALISVLFNQFNFE